MKTFVKILIVLVLVAALGGVAAFVYFTMQGNGGKQETVELLSKLKDDALDNLDDMSYEIDYYYEISTSGDSKPIFKEKHFVSYDDDIKKVAVVNFDKDLKFVSMEYFEYKIEGKSSVKWNHTANYVEGFEFSNDARVMSYEEYKENCSYHVEFQMESILEEIKDEKIDYSENPDRSADDRYYVDLTTNIFTQVKTIEVVGEVKASQYDVNYKATIKLKDDLLTSYSNTYVLNHDTNSFDVTSKLTVSYKYSGGTINPDKIYKEYAK